MSAQENNFRDHIGTIAGDGQRRWIFAKKMSGKLYQWRGYVSYIYLLIFFTLPWIKVNGNPLFLFNIAARRFILFGQIFWPQDFFVFVIAMLTFIVFIVLFTVVYGRVFCGWVCPQTIFMEMVFRKIEYLIEGNADQQRRLAQQPWNTEKVVKKTGKAIAFFTLSFIIANYFLAYIMGMDNVLLYIHEGIFNHLGTFIPLVVFTVVFFFVYMWFREQVCIIVCPYGRLQGVMLDADSIVVAYDYKRGEERGKFNRHEERTKGDCVDCMECVKVCPTGIDIRNGTQLECVNCTACIDACNTVMDKFSFAPGLIRYASENAIAKGEHLKFNLRTKAYTAVLVVLVGVLVMLLATRKEIQTTVMRAQGMLYQKQAGGQISNLYNVKMINKTIHAIPVEIIVEEPQGATVKMIGKHLTVPKESIGDGMFFIMADPHIFHHRKNKIQLGLYVQGKKVDEISTTFMAPDN
jgi:cytochrome c oxidase accessory protein FixG